MKWKQTKRDGASEKGVGSVADDLMAQLGTMVFACDCAGGYRRMSPIPAWLNAFAPEDTRVADARDLPFAFLGVFLDACDDALASPGVLPPLNEIWHERDAADVEHSFSARLLELGAAPHLLLQCLDRDFAEQQAVFQQARNQKLTLDALSRAEAALRDSQQQLNLIMRQAPAVFWCTDANGRMTYCSGSARDVFGASVTEWVGESVTALFEGTDKSDEVVLSAHEIALAGESTTFAVCCGERSFDVRVEPLYADPGNDPVGATGVGVESTERVKAEADAAAALQAKTDFVTGISHEIRTPMNAIIGLTELALDLPLSPEQQVYLKSAISSGESLLSVIDQLLDFSKIERGSNVLDRVAFSLGELITDVASGLAVHAHGKGVELVTLIGADVPDGFVGDSGRLRQILVNLAGNAIKFTHEGEVCIQVLRDQGSASAPHMQLHIVVRDTGIGVLPEKQELIFEAFRQAEPGTIRKYGGTGLGLSIALELTRMMGGRIWVVSPGDAGVGSDFHFTVILEAATTSENEQPAPIPRESLPSSCLLLGIPGAPLTAMRRLLESHFGEIVEMAVDLESASPVVVPVADASGVVVLEVPADHKARNNLMAALGDLPDGIGSLVAVCPVGMLPVEMVSLRRLSDVVVLKPIRAEALRSALLGVAGTHCTEGHVPSESAAARLRILIAEDDELSQWVLASICRNRGHEVTLVSNGTDAVDLVEQRSFDVLLLDIQMPDYDGYDVTRCIRRFEESERAESAVAAVDGGSAKSGRHLSIIALTAHVGAEVRKRCLASGMDGYLAKPVRAQELFSMLEGLRIENDGRPGGRDAPALEPLDWAQLDAFVGGDDHVRKSVLTAAVKLLPEALLKIETALQAFDFTSVKEDAHRVKGMAGNIGARDLASAAASLERAAARQDTGGGRARLVEMRSECDRLVRFLDAPATPV